MWRENRPELCLLLFFLPSRAPPLFARPPARPASGRPSVAVRAGCLLSRISFQNPANFQGPFIAFPPDRRPISNPRPLCFLPFLFSRLKLGIEGKRFGVTVCSSVGSAIERSLSKLPVAGWAALSRVKGDRPAQSDFVFRHWTPRVSLPASLRPALRLRAVPLGPRRDREEAELSNSIFRRSGINVSTRSIRLAA